MNASEHYQAGRLAEAIAAAAAAVKANPNDLAGRGFLCELLCFAGDLERADKQLDALGQLDPQSLLGVALWRQLVRAEQARGQLYSDGRLPEFLDKPSPQLELRLEATVRLREGQPQAAADLLRAAEDQRAHPSGTCDGRAFDDLRDLDDLTASFFEVLTTTGKYYWIPMERVERIELPACQRPRDLLWRRAQMVVRDGPDGEVYLPALYSGSAGAADQRVRLGRVTEWLEGERAPVRGIGQRTLLVGDEARPILEISTLEIRA